MPKGQQASSSNRKQKSKVQQASWSQMLKAGRMLIHQASAASRRQRQRRWAARHRHHQRQKAYSLEPGWLGPIS